MDTQQFSEIFEKRFHISDSMLNSKRKEYANGNVDVLHNFRQAAHLEQCTMRQALGGFLVKHIVSVFDMIHEDDPRSMEVWSEKIGDAINYLILLEAIVTEELEGLEEIEKPKPRPRPTIVNHPENPEKDSDT